MPATAGRVRMPANNRVHSSAALQTHGIWQSAIGYDPYAPDQKQPPASASGGGDPHASASGPSEQQNTYDSFQGLLALARLTGSNADEARGACRKCGRVGHLPFQCRNFLKDDSAAVASVTAAVSNIASHLSGSSQKKERTQDKSVNKAVISSSDEDDVSDSYESEISDSSQDSEMERAVAAKFGKDILKTLCAKKSRSSYSRNQSNHKKSHSKRHKGKIEDKEEVNHEKKLKRSSRSKRSYSNISTSDSDDASDVEHRRKRRRHSSKHRKSKSKHHTNYSDDSSDGKKKKNSRKRRSSHKHHRDTESD
ncbi:hypothetical protein KP509_33G054700 [Ceratopteris richardii]|uniref:CCHC-type domain-containing protein n=1 Tax=Ceratopteris richardii TaxID=49495 RepID=A0A8T2QR87_CERRI|nr:hypothetical protein KP509_33G054700 [Ceratopteris richardii]